MAYPTLDPNELAFLQKFYDDARAGQGFSGDSLAAQDLAARIILSYQKGARTKIDIERAITA
jgi:hypothetical protein